MIAGGWANLAGGPAAVAAASGATAAADAGGAGEGPDATAEARASGGPAAADWLVVGEVNQQALFRRVAAVVHHGGAGITTTAALAGAPQVVIPQIVDQPHWARRVQELGIGVAHPGPVPTVESLTDALRTALAPAMLARARAVAPEIRTDGATIAARLLHAS